MIGFSVRRLRTGGAYLLALFAIAAVFGWGTLQTSEYFGTLSDHGHQWLTAHSVLIVDNWIEDGFLESRGVAFWTPRSIEVASLAERRVYVSYIPGAQWPLFLAKRLAPATDTIELAHLLGRVNHLLVALVIFLIVVNLRFGLERSWVILFAALGAIAYLVMPPPGYWHAMVYFADQAVILPFVLALFLEVLIRNHPRRWLYLLQSVILAWVATIDYLVIPLALVLLLFRWICPVRGARVRSRLLLVDAGQLGMPLLFVYAVFVVYLHHLGLTEPLWAKFMERTGIDAGVAGLAAWTWFRTIFLQHMHPVFGGIFLFLLLMFLALMFRERSERTAIVLVAILAALLQVALLANHSMVHSFSALKFFVPIAVGLFAVLPLLVLEHRRLWLRKRAVGEAPPEAGGWIRWMPNLAVVAILAGLSALLVASYARGVRGFPEPVVQDADVAAQIGRHASFEDVFIGLDGFGIGITPPQKLALARKRVWRFADGGGLHEFLARLPVGASIHFVVRRGSACAEQLTEFGRIDAAAWSVFRIGDARLAARVACGPGPAR